uniref:Uncharacterized protein n=1 Tax=Panagrellus redivivus TaxID=6233 RepID=A0A7E4UYK5_PANRE
MAPTRRHFNLWYQTGRKLDISRMASLASTQGKGQKANEHPCSGTNLSAITRPNVRNEQNVYALLYFKITVHAIVVNAMTTAKASANLESARN